MTSLEKYSTVIAASVAATICNSSFPAAASAFLSPYSKALKGFLAFNPGCCSAITFDLP
jgi:hypothetical protein